MKGLFCLFLVYGALVGVSSLGVESPSSTRSLATPMMALSNDAEFSNVESLWKDGDDWGLSIAAQSESAVFVGAPGALSNGSSGAGVIWRVEYSQYGVLRSATVIDGEGVSGIASAASIPSLSDELEAELRIHANVSDENATLSEVFCAADVCNATKLSYPLASLDAGFGASLAFNENKSMLVIGAPGHNRGRGAVCVVELGGENLEAATCEGRGTALGVALGLGVDDGFGSSVGVFVDDSGGEEVIVAGIPGQDRIVMWGNGLAWDVKGEEGGEFGTSLSVFGDVAAVGAPNAERVILVNITSNSTSFPRTRIESPSSTAIGFGEAVVFGVDIDGDGEQGDALIGSRGWGIGVCLLLSPSSYDCEMIGGGEAGLGAIIAGSFGSSLALSTTTLTSTPARIFIGGVRSGGEDRIVDVAVSVLGSRNVAVFENATADCDAIATNSDGTNDAAVVLLGCGPSLYTSTFNPSATNSSLAVMMELGAWSGGDVFAIAVGNQSVAIGGDGVVGVVGWNGTWIVGDVDDDIGSGLAASSAGRSLAWIEDDEILLVGAPESEAVVVLHVNGTVLRRVEGNDAIGASGNDPKFGSAVAFADGFAAIGAPKTDGVRTPAAGAVYLLASPTSHSSTIQCLSSPAATPNAHAGAGVALGDVDGDGVVDVIVAMPGISTVAIVFTTYSTPLPTPTHTITFASPAPPFAFTPSYLLTISSLPNLPSLITHSLPATHASEKPVEINQVHLPSTPLPTTGGAEVMIWGSGLSDDLRIKVGDFWSDAPTQVSSNGTWAIILTPPGFGANLIVTLYSRNNLLSTPTSLRATYTPPTVTYLTPSLLPQRNRTQVFLQGYGFVVGADLEVEIGGVSCVDANVVAVDLVECMLGEIMQDGVLRVNVTLDASSQAATVNDGVGTRMIEPEVTGIVPQMVFESDNLELEGCSSGGSGVDVMVVGKWFGSDGDVTNVSIAGVECQNFTWINASAVQCFNVDTSCLHPPSGVSLTLLHTVTSPPFPIPVVPIPVVDGVERNRSILRVTGEGIVPTDPNLQVHIAWPGGNRFSEPSPSILSSSSYQQVLECEDVRVLEDGELECELTLAFGSDWDVLVTNGGGVTSAPGNAFVSFSKATVTSISPPSYFFNSAATPNVSVDINGTRFVQDQTRVWIGVQECDITSLTNTSLSCNISPNSLPPGVHLVQVRVGGVNAKLPSRNGLRIEVVGAPILTAATPATVASTRGQRGVVFVGENFALPHTPLPQGAGIVNVTVSRVGGDGLIHCENLRVLSETTLTCDVSAGSGKDLNTTLTSVVGFTATAPVLSYPEPQITAIAPNYVYPRPSDGPIVFTISGYALGDTAAAQTTTTITLPSNIPCPILTATHEEITCGPITPSTLLPGALTWKAEWEGERLVTTPVAEFEVGDLPSVRLVEPTVVPIGDLLVIAGKNFGQSKDDLVSITLVGAGVGGADVTCESPKFLSSEVVDCVFPSAAIQPGQVIVETVLGRSNASTDITGPPNTIPVENVVPRQPTLDRNPADTTSGTTTFLWCGVKKPLEFDIAFQSPTTSFNQLNESFVSVPLELFEAIETIRNGSTRCIRFRYAFTSTMIDPTPYYAAIRGSNGDRAKGRWSRFTDPAFPYCATGQYLPTHLTVDKQECLDCPEGAYCPPGGDSTTLVTRENYYRLNWNEYIFQPCTLPNACGGFRDDKEVTYIARAAARLEGNARRRRLQTAAPLAVLIADEARKDVMCKGGTQGVLCAVCSDDHALDITVGACTKCPAQVGAILILCVGFVFMICLVAFLLRSAITAMGKLATPRRTVFTKILFNHIQFVSILAQFRLSWPPTVGGFLLVSDSASSIVDTALSPECLVPRPPSSMGPEAAEQARLGGAALEGAGWSAFRARTIATLAAPFVLYGFIWVAVLGGKLVGVIKSWRQAKRLWFTTLLVLMYSMYMPVTKAALRLFSCVEIEGSNRLENDVNVACDAPGNVTWRSVVGYPIMILIGVGVPIITAIAIYSFRDPLRLPPLSVSCDPLRPLRLQGLDHDSGETMGGFAQPLLRNPEMSFGAKSSGFRSTPEYQHAVELVAILLVGYKPRAWFTESLIMLRKSFFVAIAVFLAGSGVEMQAYACAFFILLILLIQLYSQPYALPELNRADEFSLVFTLATMLAGLFLSSNTPSDSVKVLMTVFILLINFIFVITMLGLIIRELIWGNPTERKVKPVDKSSTKEDKKSEDDDESPGMAAAEIDSPQFYSSTRTVEDSRHSNLRSVRSEIPVSRGAPHSKSLTKSPSYFEIVRAAQRVRTPPSTPPWADAFASVRHDVPTASASTPYPDNWREGDELYKKKKSMGRKKSSKTFKKKKKKKKSAAEEEE